jgi:hypothetical protein
MVFFSFLFDENKFSTADMSSTDFKTTVPFPLMTAHEDLFTVGRLSSLRLSVEIAALGIR